MSLRDILRTTAIFLPVVLGNVNFAATTITLPFPGVTIAGTPPRTFPDSQNNDLSKQEGDLREAIRRTPNSAGDLARLGSVLAMENKLEEAVPYLEKALARNPSDFITRRTLAAAYWQLGQAEKARKNLELVLKAKPDDTVAMLLLGMVSEDLGNHQRATRLLGGVLPLVRQRPETIAFLARAYYHIGETQKARDTLQMLVGHAAGPEAAFQGGQFAAEFEDYDAAEKMFLLVQTTYPNTAAVDYNLALAQFSAKRYAECEKTLLASIGHGHGTADAYALLGRAYQKQDNLPEMLKAFEKAINTEPANQAYYVVLGDALAEKKNYDTALEVAEEAVKRFPSSSRAYGLKGSIELKMDFLTEALKSYTRAVELDPDDARSALGLALTQWNMDRTDEAAKSFEEGARKFPRDAFFQLKYALFLLNAAGERNAEQNARIKALLNRSAELDPSDAETHFQLGNLAMKDDKYDEAQRELQIAAKLDPELSKVHLALARVYRRAGRVEEAEKESQLHRKLKASEEPNADANAAVGTRHP